MKAVLENKEGHSVTFTFELGVEEFNKARQEAYLQNRNSFNIPGFRKGKVPRQIIEMNFGKEIFFEEAVNILLPEAYEAAVEELELDVVAQPQIDIDEINENEPVVVTATVDVVPEVKLGDYKNIELEKTEVEITDEMVDGEIKRIQEQNARLVDVGEKEIEEGNIANIDFEGFIDGEAFEGGSDKAYDLTIGEGMFIPGFEEQLVGHKKGDEVDVELTFPEDYHAEDLAGEEVVFKVKINNVREKELPELDDEFALDISEFDTLEEFRNDLKEQMQERASQEADASFRDNLVEKVIADIEVDIPRSMIEAEIDDELGQMDFRFRQQGLDLSSYLEMTGEDMLGLREQIEPMVIQRIKATLALEEIAKVEGLTVEDEDIDKELEELAKQNQAEDVEEFKEQMKAAGNLELLSRGILNSKVIDFLIENLK